MPHTAQSLSDVFTAITIKLLAAVDLPDGPSHQHEINGSVPLRDFFQTTERVSGEIQWHYFSDISQPTSELGTYTFYNARENRTHRAAEWRLYYPGDFLRYASVGDTLVLARDHDGKVYGLVFAKDSGWLRAVRVLFGFTESKSQFELYDAAELGTRSLAFVRQQILDEFGIEFTLPALSSDEDLMHEKFGMEFPTTRTMSDLARSLVDSDPMDADELLARWIERELQLFTALERRIVWQRIEIGFESVEDFLYFSKSVHNRRKSRMGHALENHLEALFVHAGLRYQRGGMTEGKNKPDFLFPGTKEYHDAGFDASHLVMLGAKSTLKDRWRQVLTEADRIPSKHLCTLETAISVDQTAAMHRSRVTLVIPSSLHSTYTQQQQTDLLSIVDFIDHVRSTQS